MAVRAITGIKVLYVELDIKAVNCENSVSSRSRLSFNLTQLTSKWFSLQLRKEFLWKPEALTSCSG